MISETMNWTFEKMNDSDKPLVKLIKREKNQISRLEDERGILQQMSLKYKELLINILKLYTSTNLKFS